jgi:hypothetical protein
MCAMQKLTIPGQGTFDVIKPLVGFVDEMQERLRVFPYAENVFLMLKFRPSNRALSDFIVETLEEHGLRGVRADQPEWNITNNLYNPLAVLYCCRYGLALFDEPEEHQAYSPNVAYELGMMHLQGKLCLLLKHDSLPEVPFDLIKDLYQLYSRDLDVRRIVGGWVHSITSAGTTACGAELEVPVVEPAPPAPALEVSYSPALAAFEPAFSIVQKNPSYWKFAWKISVLNRSRGDLRCRIEVQFLNASGLAVEDQLHLSDVALAPNQQRTFSDFRMIELPTASEIQTLRFTVTPR